MTPGTDPEAEELRPPSWLVRVRSSGLTLEWAIVCLMVGAAVLSAVAFWQGTLFAEQSAALTNRARFAGGYLAQQQSGVEARIAHDRQVLLRCRTAIERRDAALERYSQLFDEPSASTFAEAEHTQVALSALLVADSDCAGYQVRRALEWADFRASGQLGFGNPEALLREAAAFSNAERWAVMGAVGFALALLLATVADAAKSAAWIRRWLVLGLATMVIGGALAVTAFVTGARIPLDALILILALMLVIGLVVSLPLVARIGTSGRLTGWTGERLQGIRHRARAVGMAQPMRTWAEIFGALTVVVFALAVLGYATSSSRERDSLATADNLASQARHALEIGQQSALAAMNFASQLSELDAQSVSPVGGVQQEALSAGLPEEQARAAVSRDLWLDERSAWQAMLEVYQGARADCLDDNLILAWKRSPDGDGDLRPRSFPEDLLAEYRDDPQVMSKLIDRSSAGASLCSIRATVTWQQAQEWGQRASLFTVALVALGLAGFLFALAADPDRTVSPRRWLFVSGSVGMLAGLAVAAWALGAVPRLPEGSVLRDATRAYVESDVAQRALECSTASEASGRAVADLIDFPPAHVRHAEAVFCAPDQAWLINPWREQEQTAAYIDHLQKARQLGLESAAVDGNLGWGYLLSALQASSPDKASEAIERARAQTQLALESAPSNPFWCFNRALIELAAGDQQTATTYYVEALASLEGSENGTGQCRAVPFDDPSLGYYVRLLALADLELLPEQEEHDAYRSLLLRNLEPIEESCATDFHPGQPIELYPESVWLPTRDSGGTPPYSVVWYHRPAATLPWSVMLAPSRWTVQPGCHAGLLDAGQLLGAGEYRADVYVDGELVHRDTTDSWWADAGLAPDAFSYVHAPDLGMSLIVPSDWEVASARAGVEIVFAGEGGSVAISRSEGGDSEALVSDGISWSNVWLEQWGVEPITTEEVGTENAAWYVGLARTLAVTARETPSTIIFGVGHQQYLIPPPGQGVAAITDVSHASCPGTRMTTLIHADDPAVADAIWLSQFLVRTPHTVSVEIPNQEEFVGPQFAVELPEGWAAAACPGSLSAKSPDGIANVLIGSEPRQGSLRDVVEASLAAYRDPEEGFAEFELESRARVATADGTPAEELTFSWTSDGFRVRQTQLYVMSVDRTYYMTFTTGLEDFQRLRRERELLLTSFGLVGGEHLIPASCRGCSSTETASRQASVDELAGLLDVIDDAHCADTTDDASADAAAAIACGWPGGFSAEFVLWRNARSMSALADRYEAIPRAEILEWRTHAEQVEPTGRTVEWVEDGNARFFWTYDVERVTADATLVGGDQQRLNNWWQTSGALLRE